MTTALIRPTDHEPWVPGAMLTVMAACPPAPPSPRPRGWASAAGQERQAELRLGRQQADLAGSPLGQVRALAWLLAHTSLPAATCSRLAAGARGCGCRARAEVWLHGAGLGWDEAKTAAGLAWLDDDRRALWPDDDDGT